MANVLIAGGGFAGVVAAELLAKKLGREHEISLVSRHRKFVYYPALVRFAFDECTADEIEFNVRETLTDHRIRFLEGEVARVYPSKKHITFAHGDVEGDIPYDYLILALGRRLKTEAVPGFNEHANHLLTLNAAEKFGRAVKQFNKGTAIIGYCDGARLAVPVFETAFALARKLAARGTRSDCQIKIVANESLNEMFGGAPISESLTETLKSHDIELINDFSITKVTSNEIFASDGRRLEYDLNMVLPPYSGPGALIRTGLVDQDGYIVVDAQMRASKGDSIYAIGDCVSLPGPKMGHMAVRQATVAVENLIKQIQGEKCTAAYEHELMLVIDTGGESTFVHYDLSGGEAPTISQSRFWGWAKRKQQQFWQAQHS